MEIVLSVLVGVAAFIIAALVSTAARSHVPSLLLGLLFLLAVLAVARFAGILYALPVGVVTIEAFDWYFLPPLRNLDRATVLVLGLFLAMAVIVGAVATQAGRRAAESEQARGVLADEQAALRRVATLIARQPSPAEVFAEGGRQAPALRQCPPDRLRAGSDRDGGRSLQPTGAGAAGGHPGTGGSGIIGLKDRVEALGGTISMLSPPGHGTALHVQLPANPMVVPALPGRTP